MRSLLLLFLLSGLCSANVIVSEIMYNPRQGNDFQYIELYNTDSNSVDLTGWSFTSADETFTFPSSSSIGGNSYVILAKDVPSFLFAYPDVPSNIVYDGIHSISTSSGRINLKTPDGTAVLDYKYKDGWQPLSDGYGPSLELVCYQVSDYTDGNSWRASTLPTYQDSLVEYSGSPNAAGTWYTCPPPVNSYPNINLKFSEIMYKPSQEKSREDQHEWLEIYNADSSDLSLNGYRIVGKKGLLFSFPADAVIAAKSYVVVAKNPTAYSAVYSTPSKVYGPYSGQLPNGGDSLVIADTNGRVVEEISYNNKWPFPIAADIQAVQAQYAGLSIERVSFNYGGSKAHNWVASTPTPGAANSAARDIPLPVVTDINILQNGKKEGEILAPSVSTDISVDIAPKSTFTNVVLEYYVDDIHSTDEQTTSVTMTENSNGTYVANFPSGFPAKTILRFQVKVDYNGGATGQVVSHRSNDPIQWHGIYFSLQEVYDNNSTNYEIMITSEQWSAMFTNMRTDTNGHKYLDTEDGKCCQPNLLWNKDSIAVMAYKGKVYDVEVKYQGSNFNRMNGDNLDAFQSDENPTEPSPVRQLSWKIKLADYDSKIDGRDFLIIQKAKNYGCSYFTGYGLYKLARQLGLPAPKVQFSKLYVNGAYYLYGMDLDYFSSDMLQRYIDDHNMKNCRHQPTMQVGFAYKAMGYGCTEGYDGLADFQLLKESTGCSATIPAATRYDNAYSLESETSYGDTTRIQQLTYKIGKYNYVNGNLESLDFTEPVSQDVKNYMTENFDVNLILNYLVLINWAGAYDDLVGNYMLYARQDGKMSMTTWDMDALMGENSPCLQASCSLFLGEQGAPVSEYNAPGGYNNLKDALIKTFRAELQERYRVLAQTVLSVENVNKVMQEAQAAIDLNAMNDPNVFPGVPFNNMKSECYNNITSWNSQRNNYVQTTLGNPQNTTVNACPDVAPLANRYVATYRAVPGVPDSPTLVKNSGTSVTVSWSAPNSNGLAISGYTLQRSVDDGDFTTVYSGSAQTYQDNDFSTKKIQYRVQATNSMGTSPYSAPVVVIGGVVSSPTTGALPPLPSQTTTGSSATSSGSVLCASLLAYLLAIIAM